MLSKIARSRRPASSPAANVRILIHIKGVQLCVHAFIETVPKHKGNSTVGLSGPIGGEVSADPYAARRPPTASHLERSTSGRQSQPPRRRLDLGNNGALDDGILTTVLDRRGVETAIIWKMARPRSSPTHLYQVQKFAPSLPSSSHATATCSCGMTSSRETFQKASSPAEADITFGFVQMSPAAGAHAYYPRKRRSTKLTDRGPRQDRRRWWAQLSLPGQLFGRQYGDRRLRLVRDHPRARPSSVWRMAVTTRQRR